MGPKKIGLSIVVVLMLMALIWLPAIASAGQVVALFSQYLGMTAIIAMAISQLIATRWSWIEWVFGPLDQSYRVHKWLG